MYVFWWRDSFVNQSYYFWITSFIMIWCTQICIVKWNKIFLSHEIPFDLCRFTEVVLPAQKGVNGKLIQHSTVLGMNADVILACMWSVLLYHIVVRFYVRTRILYHKKWYKTYVTSLSRERDRLFICLFICLFIYFSSSISYLQCKKWDCDWYSTIGCHSTPKQRKQSNNNNNNNNNNINLVSCTINTSTPKWLKLSLHNLFVYITHKNRNINKSWHFLFLKILNDGKTKWRSKGSIQ